jgi:thioredoxin-related protein
LVRETYQDPGVVKALNDGFIPVHLEARDNLDLAQQFEVRYTPTMLLFSHDGVEKHRFGGFLTAAEFLGQLSSGGKV